MSPSPFPFRILPLQKKTPFKMILIKPPRVRPGFTTFCLGFRLAVLSVRGGVLRVGLSRVRQAPPRYIISEMHRSGATRQVRLVRNQTGSALQLVTAACLKDFRRAARCVMAVASSARLFRAASAAVTIAPLEEESREPSSSGCFMNSATGFLCSLLLSLLSGGIGDRGSKGLELVVDFRVRQARTTTCGSRCPVHHRLRVSATRPEATVVRQLILNI